MVRALTAVLLLAVLSTALFVHLIWQAAAGRGVEAAVRRLNAGASATVNRELAETLAGAEGAAEVIRSALFQGTVDAHDEMRREFLFLSVLRSQPAVTWIGFGFPDGRFFGARQTGERIEMVEIGAATDADAPRPLRRDVYRPIPGDIFFEQRLHGQTHYVTLGSPWYRAAIEGDGAAWTTATLLPAGFEPAVVVATRVERFGEFAGVVMVAIALERLSQLLASLDIAAGGGAFVLDGAAAVLATSAPASSARAASLDDYPADDGPARAVRGGLAIMPDGDFVATVDITGLGPVYVTASALPFRDWRLLTAIPRSRFAADIDRASRFVPYVIAALALLAAATSALFASLLFARPLARLSAELGKIGRFDLDGVGYQATFLSELDEFALALRRMAVGLSSFGRYIPVEVVRMLVGAGFAPVPGGEVREITVMFADLPGFTEMSERLGPDVAPYLTRFLTLAVDIVHREGGTVDKFIGDEVMAFWNAPGDVADHAARACRAAIALRAGLHAIPLPLPGPGSFAAGPRVRIGINTGNAIVGNVGSTTRLSYTAIGDTVNLASRLVGIAKEHGVEIAVAEATLAAAGDRLSTRPLGRLNVRGRSAPVAVHAVDGPLAATMAATTLPALATG